MEARPTHSDVVPQASKFFNFNVQRLHTARPCSRIMGYQSYYITFLSPIQSPCLFPQLPKNHASESLHLHNAYNNTA